MKHLWIGGFLACLLVSCSSLPVPQQLGVGAGKSIDQKAAMAVLKKSAAAHGDPWRSYQKVRVAYTGEWSSIATKLQPIITDPQFRKSSEELYQPRQRSVNQTHRGPSGVKTVDRLRPKTMVSFNDRHSQDSEVTAAAALVADAYTVFLFGSSWLAENARSLALLPERTFDGKPCQLVTGRLAPGLGDSKEDFFIAWLEKESGLLRRFQFSLNGMESTRGADVDVVFSDYMKAADGSVWASHFLETIQRPIKVKAHEWQLTAVTLDGRPAKLQINR